MARRLADTEARLESPPLTSPPTLPLPQSCRRPSRSTSSPRAPAPARSAPAPSRPATGGPRTPRALMAHGWAHGPCAPGAWAPATRAQAAEWRSGTGVCAGGVAWAAAGGSFVAMPIPYRRTPPASHGRVGSISSPQVRSAAWAPVAWAFLATAARLHPKGPARASSAVGLEASGDQASRERGRREEGTPCATPAHH
jgi:hypothetical protein